MKGDLGAPDCWGCQAGGTAVCPTWEELLCPRPVLGAEDGAGSSAGLHGAPLSLCTGCRPDFRWHLLSRGLFLPEEAGPALLPPPGTCLPLEASRVCIPAAGASRTLVPGCARGGALVTPGLEGGPQTRPAPPDTCGSLPLEPQWLPSFDIWPRHPDFR